jgi:DNA-binding transcriptional MerR regulator
VVPAEIPDKLYYRIGEVEAITEIPAYVLRYWESEFKLLRPKKNPAGQRLYRRKDVDLVLRIKTLLYEERLTLEGAKKRLRSESRSDQLDLAARLEFPTTGSYNAGWVGAWRSPVAHLTGGQGVAGSNPVAPTISTGTYQQILGSALFLCLQY